MGLGNRQRACAIPDPERRRRALDRFTHVAKPITWPEWQAQRERLRVGREAREAGWEMTQGWKVPVKERD